MSRLKLFLPLLIFCVLALVFWHLLSQEGYDPEYLPSALIDRPMPDFHLESVEDAEVMLSNSDLPQEPFLLNVWATWCISCRVEHPYLNRLAEEQGVQIVGLNYKDDRDKALQWFERLGSPYMLNLYDEHGRLGLDLGVYGAPETYVLDAKGIIRYRHVGVVDERVWQNTLQPVYKKWQARK